MIISITLIFLLLLLSIGKPNSVLNNNINGKFILLFNIFLVSVSIISRQQIDDTFLYIKDFMQMYGQSWNVAKQISDVDPLFFLLQFITSRFTSSSFIFLSVCWFVFLFVFLKFLRNYFTAWQSVLIFYSYTCFSFFYSYTTMALRQGLSLVFILLAMSLLVNDEKEKKLSLKTILCLIAPCLFHWSAIPVVVILFICHFNFFKFSSIFIAWIMSAILYLFNLQEKILSPIAAYIPKIDVYSSSFNHYLKGGNRIDFLLFSFLWIFISVFLYRYFFRNETYLKIIKIYILFNIVFLIFGFVAYSDRIAGYSWIMIPLLIWYPILHNKKYRPVLSMVVILGFTFDSIYTNVYKYLIPFNI